MRFLLLASLALLCGCPYVVGLPPAKAEIGSLVMTSKRPNSPLRVSAGPSWASASLQRNIPFDLTGGFVYELSETGRDAHGAFVEGTTRIAGEGSWRALAGMRSEMLHDSTWAGGVSARLSLEVFTAGHGSAPIDDTCVAGVIGARGQTALGTYVETGYRRYPNEHVATVTAGISVRIPAIVSAGLIIPLSGC